MKYTIQKLVERDPALVTKLKAHCYDLNGCCQTVHAELGPFLNEYIYQEALAIILNEKNIPFEKEYYFSVEYHGHAINHKHYVDFRVREEIFIECKAVVSLGPEQRQQLWNYMRLTKTRIGILYNFAPVRDQAEHYYLDTATDTMYIF